MSAPIVGILPPPPNPQQPPKEFDQSAFAFTSALQQWTGDINTLVAWLNSNVNLRQPVNKTSASNVLDADDSGLYIRFTYNGEKTLTVNPESITPQLDGAYYLINNIGTGNLTIVPGSGVTISPDVVIETASSVFLQRIAENTYDVIVVGGEFTADLTALENAIEQRIKGPSSSLDNEVILFDGTTGKEAKRGQTMEQYFSAFRGTLSKSDVGLSNVDNTSDLNKPISTDTQDALDLKSNLRDQTVQLIKKSAASFAPGNQTQYSAIVILGDSNSEGAGTTSGSYESGMVGKFVRAIHNAYDRGPNTDRGFQFESVLNMGKSGIRGLSIGGGASITTGAGVCDSRITIPNGGFITITGREISSLDVFYEAGLSTGQLQFSLNGAYPYKTVPISGTGTKDTAQGNPGGSPSHIYGVSSFYVKATDVLTITSVGGTVVVTEVLAIRTSSNAPLIYSLPRQGWGFQDFSDTTRVAEAATHINRFAGSGNKCVFILLGTNNQNLVVGRELNPTDYIAALDLLISRYRTALNAPGGLTRFAVWVPHKTDDPRMPGFTYQDYIDAIVNYCDASVDTQCIRMDMSAVGYNSAYLADNRHFNDIGHSIAAHVLCDSIGVPPNFIFPARIRSQFAGVAFTPSVFGTSTAGVNTYAAQSGSYYTEGTTNKFKMTVTLNGNTTPMVGNVRISTGIPQSQIGANEALSVGSFAGVTLPAGRTQLVAEMLAGFSIIRLLAVGSNVAPIELVAADVNTSSFSITLSGVILSQ